MKFRGVLGLVAALVAACGGGGGGAPSPRLVIHSGPITATATTTQPPGDKFFGISVTNPPPAQNLYAAVEHTTSAVEAVGFLSQAPDAATIYIAFKEALAPGTHNDTITVHVCRDALCTQEIDGSPAEVQVTVTVTRTPRSGPPPEPEADIAPLPIANQQLLAHDVIDAEYSNALDAIVMVSAAPSPALHVYDAATGTEQSIALPSAPTAVSVSPDGLSAAVAHANTISIVDLDNIGTPLIQLLNVSEQILDVVLAGNGYVHALPWTGSKIHSVNIATNMETQVNGFSGGGAKLHPSGTKIYVTSSSMNIARYGVAAGVAAADYPSPNHVTYDMCGNLWLDEPGARIFTACGYTFRTSDNRADDMTFAGELELASTRMRSLSHSTEHAEVALLEDTPTCSALDDPDDVNCYTRLSLYESTYLDLVERYSLAPVDVAGELYAQRGKFIFHSADGSTRYLVSRRVDWPDAEAYMVGEVTVAGSPPPGADPLAPPPPVVTASTEAGIPAAALADAAAIPHDVVDAEFSTALNAIVMASSFPANAVYIHDVATRTERSIALTLRPTSVSVAPDGMHAAVGHDGKVTVLDLAAAGAQPPIPLVTSIDVGDVVMAGNGYAYAFPRTSTQPVRSLHVATGTETQSSDQYLGSTSGRLHPAGDKMYGGHGTVALQRYSLAVGTAELAYDAPPGYLICNNVWFNEAGTRIHTACGNTFQSSDDPDQDMLFGGAMALTSSEYRAVSVSESAEAAHIALLERTEHNCTLGNPASCLSHANLYDSATLARTARYSLSPFTVGQRNYPQRGLFVFDDGAGTNRYVVSRLYGMPNPYAEFYISRLQ